MDEAAAKLLQDIADNLARLDILAAGIIALIETHPDRASLQVKFLELAKEIDGLPGIEVSDKFQSARDTQYHSILEAIRSAR